MVEMAILPKGGDSDFETGGKSGGKKSMCPKFKVIGDPESVSVEWMEFVQDFFDKLILSIVIAGLIFFAYYSV